MVIDFVWVEIDLRKLIAEGKESVAAVQSLNKPAEIEVFDDVAYVLTESADVVLKIEVDIVRVRLQSRQVVLRDIVETGVDCPSDDRWESIFGYLVLKLIVGLNGFLFSSVLV